MRKLFLLILAGFSLTAAHAQLLFGIKGGANLSSIDSRNYGELKWKTNFHAGVLVSIPVISHFSLQPEIMYSGQGARSTEAGVTSNLNIDYMNIPILVKYKHPSGFFLETGPQIGWLLNAKLLLPNYNEDFKYLYSSKDISWAFGLGYLIKEANLGFDVRYNMGMNDLFKNNFDGSGHNNVVQVGAFFLFSLKAAPRDHGL